MEFVLHQISLLTGMPKLFIEFENDMKILESKNIYSYKPDNINRVVESGTLAKRSNVIVLSLCMINIMFKTFVIYIYIYI